MPVWRRARRRQHWCTGPEHSAADAEGGVLASGRVDVAGGATAAEIGGVVHWGARTLPSLTHCRRVSPLW